MRHERKKHIENEFHFQLRDRRLQTNHFTANRPDFRIGKHGISFEWFGPTVQTSNEKIKLCYPRTTFPNFEEASCRFAHKLVTTPFELDNFRITRNLGIVRGITVRSPLHHRDYRRESSDISRRQHHPAHQSLRARPRRGL